MESMFSLPSPAARRKHIDPLSRPIPIAAYAPAVRLNRADTMKNTSNPSATLDAVRSKIDGIDQDLQRLMAERTRLAREVWKAKDRSIAGLAALRPAREAMMLRALAKRHGGQMPLPVLWRIWRELIIANIRAQSPVAVHVAERGKSKLIWDLARAHFGFETEMVRHGNCADALNAAARNAALAVLPADTANDWARSIGARDRFHIFCALPQITAPSGGDAVSAGPVVYLAGDVTLEPSGADTSVVLVAANPDDAMAAANQQGFEVKTCQPAAGATLLGVNGLEAAQLPQGQMWGTTEVRGLGAYADALLWETAEEPS